MKPTFKSLALGALIWSAIMTSSAIISLAYTGRVPAPKSNLLVSFFAIGAFCAYPVARALLQLLPQKWLTTQRFSSAFIVLSVLTVGATALLVALQLSIYFSQWHDDHLSVRLLFETTFTVLSSCYQFLVLALRNYFPIGAIGLLGASWLFAVKRI